MLQTISRTGYDLPSWLPSDVRDIHVAYFGGSDVERVVGAMFYISPQLTILMLAVVPPVSLGAVSTIIEFSYWTWSHIP